MPFHWTFLGLVVILAPCAGELDVDLIRTCCMAGSEVATRFAGRCTSYPSQIQNVSPQDMDTCLSLVDLCCKQSARSQLCDVGRDIARSDNSCDAITIQGADTESFVHKQECCHCCQMGMFAATSSRDCEMFERSGKICDGSPDCCEAFYTCCNSTSSSGFVTTTTTLPTTTLSPDVPPSHAPGGICDRYSTSLCEHYCHDAPDRLQKFRCSCKRGYELASNERNCDESTVQQTCQTHSPCAESAECYMRGGLPMCRCPRQGYRLVNGYACEDVDECLQGLDTCTEKERCDNQPGGYTCVTVKCSSDAVYDPLTGTCVRGSTSGGGDPHTTCRSDQVYDHRVRACVSARPVDQVCPQGYAYNVLNQKCEDLDECISELLHNCTKHLTCYNIPGSFLCQCSLGMALNPAGDQCEDIDECAVGTDTCDAGQRCENTLGSYMCRRHISCGTGYTLQEDSQACIDINECQLGTHNCGPAFVCHNIPGSFRCEYKTCAPGQRLNLATGGCQGADVCQSGFAWDQFTRQCQDVDECLIENPCLSNEQCVNTDGSYKCISQSRLRCYNGYELNDAGTTCLDINECERGLHNCRSRDACQNTEGGYRCRCSNGFTLNSVTNLCEDIDECSRAFGQRCSPSNSQCVNTQGSYYCQCKEGFEQIAEGKACQDVNECLTPNICDHSCHNVWGSYQCRCRPGFRLSDDKRTCHDINECEMTATRGRLCNGFCENTPGSFRCTCPAGFRLSDNQRECIDIDECAEGLAGCSGSDQICMNTRGSFKCNLVQCPRFFTLANDGLSRNPGDDGVFCYKRCPTNGFSSECYLNSTNIISYHYLSLPSIPELLEPVTLFTLDSSSQTVYPNVVFDILSGNEGSAFRLTQDGLYQGSLQLQKPVVGPREFDIRIRMEASNLNKVISTSQIAVVKIAVSQYPAFL